MTTKAILTERIRRILDGGIPSDQSRVLDGEIMLDIASIANGLLKQQMFEIPFGYDGEAIPQGAMTCLFEKIPVSKGKMAGASEVKLPIVPMTLPQNMGVFNVYPSGEPRKEFIPIPVGSMSQLLGDKIMNPIHHTYYEWRGNALNIYADLVAAGVFFVDAILCVMSIENYGDNEPLPIAPDMEEVIIQKVVALHKDPITRREETNQPQGA